VKTSETQGNGKGEAVDTDQAVGVTGFVYIWPSSRMDMGDGEEEQLYRYVLSRSKSRDRYEGQRQK
jgi:hypothetical protein